MFQKKTKDERNAKCRTDAAEREQRVLAHYAESQGGKALEEGLMQNAECRMQNVKFRMYNAKLFQLLTTLYSLLTNLKKPLAIFDSLL